MKASSRAFAHGFGLSFLGLIVWAGCQTQTVYVYPVAPPEEAPPEEPVGPPVEPPDESNNVVLNVYRTHDEFGVRIPEDEMEPPVILLVPEPAATNIRMGSRDETWEDEEGREWRVVIDDRTGAAAVSTTEVPLRKVF